MQDKMIKDFKKSNSTPLDSSANPYSEAFSSFQTQLIEKDKEIDRLKTEMKQSQESVKREQRLMMTAWYQLGTQLQQSKGETEKRDEVSGDSPLTWLQKQRNIL